jgi:hypothetical protein
MMLKSLSLEGNLTSSTQCGLSSIGRTFPCQGKGYEFESRSPLSRPGSMNKVFLIDTPKIDYNHVETATWPSWTRQGSAKP